DIDQIEAGEIWNELALDLLLGNTEESFWGWADPQAVFMLDYWKKVEPRLKFLLIYDSPVTIFTALFNDKQVTTKKVEEEVKYWGAFYEELLHFYHRNQENCLLIHIEQIKEDLAAFSHVISAFAESSLIASDSSIKEMEKGNTNVDRADLLLMAELLKEFLGIYVAYDSLEVVADLPMTNKDKQPLTMDNVILAWNSRQETQGVSQCPPLEELEQENELLLLQLHQVQEELEHYFLENQKLKNGNTTSVSTSSSSFYYGAADRIKRQLSYRLGATMIQQSRTVNGVLMMPWALIQETRVFRKDFKMRKDEKSPPISDYQDAYEAESVKQHLSYRLGHTFVKNTNSVMGWVKLPWLLKQEVVDFKKGRGY
ncbi:MAG: hypothetical protein HAW67_00445, partial [Endozoicomonadaceae bacterium]|nr:hypothetical protein [Endozoicomonadaceae bacterium]